MHKTVVIKYSPKAKDMAAGIEETANKVERNGYEFVSCTITPYAKGILIFKKPEKDSVPDTDK